MLPFSPATRDWFSSSFDGPTPVQSEGWERIANGEHSLLLAPTGSGKTLAAFLWALDRCMDPETPEVEGVRVLYVSPLKALAYDIERNLRSPLAGIARAAEARGAEVRQPRVMLRTGDTPANERRKQLKEPGDILVTTPESLYLMLGSQVRENLRNVETVIVDEVHALAPTKRGAHLALSLERLTALCGRDPQRIGLSATATPVETVARFLGGDRDVAIVDTTRAPSIELDIVVTVPDMEHPPAEEPAQEERGGSVFGQATRSHGTDGSTGSVWPSVYERLLAEIDRHRTTIIFVNSRGLCERLAQRLNELAYERSRGDDEEEPDARPEAVPEIVRTHHGSLSHAKRRDTEELLKQGFLKGIVATSSLELGIDMAAVDHVVMVESPGSVARGLQRLGRAGHAVGETSRGSVLPKHRGDLLETAVVGRLMREGEIEPLAVPMRPLDVLAQQIVAMVAEDTVALDDLEGLVKRAASFHDLSRELLVSVLDMLAGRYPSHDFADLRPRIVWDRANDELTGRRGAKMLSLTNGGTIPDRGLYPVHLGQDGPRVGELDEEMVHESRTGHVIALGASSWRIMDITRDRVIVEGAHGEPARLPFWKGDGPGRPIELGRKLGAFLRDMSDGRTGAAELRDDYGLDDFAARNLAAYVAEQKAVAKTLPTDRNITLESFRDEMGDWRLCILSPFGARIHAPWALALEARLGRRADFDVQTLWTDDGIVLRFADGQPPPSTDDILPDPDEVEDLVVEQLAQSSVFAAAFRENAARALLLPRRRPGSRTPLWTQRLRAQNLLTVAREFPSFPIVLETYRTCLQDIFDVPSLVELLRDIRSRKVKVDVVETPTPSPFARSLVFAFTAAYLYEGDAPVAERRAQALALDRGLLRELLGQEELRSLLDAEAVDEVESELQRTADGWRARRAEELHDHLRWLGDMTVAEASLRCEPDADADAWLHELAAGGHALIVRLGGEARWIAVEDAALYRDATGVPLPPGVPAVFLDPVERPIETLVVRWARTHGPFHARDITRRLGLGAEAVEAILENRGTDGSLLHGDFHPGGAEPEWCDAEVLRRIKQRTLARLRREVSPVEIETLSHFLASWHDLGGRGESPDRLAEILAQLEGLPLSLHDLEGAILAARMPAYSSNMLDDLMATGAFVWVGESPMGRSDGRITIYRRDRIAALREPPEAPDDLEEVHLGILGHLETNGASFMPEIWSALRPHRNAEVEEALWDLAWAGLVTNDSLEVVRRRRTRPARSARSAWRSPAGGRWSLVRRMLHEVTPTERLHTQASMLLERYGVVGRSTVGSETIAGGFSALYPVFRAMEDAGKVRRGYFVEGLGGAQFSSPGAVDRLRAARREDDSAIRWLAAADPAQPWGATLAWPSPSNDDAASPRRAPGARVLLVDGSPLLWAGSRGRNVITFAALRDHERREEALRAFFEAVREEFGVRYRVETIDGDPAFGSSWCDPLREAGFSMDHKSLYVT